MRRPTGRSTVDRRSADARPTLHRRSTDVGRASVERRPTSVVRRPTLDRCTTDARPTHRSCVGRQLTDATYMIHDPENLSRSNIPSAAFLFAHNAFLSSSHEVQLTVSSFSCQDHDSKSPSLACSRPTVDRQSTDWRPTVVLSTDCRSTAGEKI